MSFEQLAVFIPVAFLLAITPGPDNLAVLALGVSNGRAAGLGFALGCAVGCLNHTLLAAIGVSALIAASPIAFSILQYAGAAYLMYLGIRVLRSAGSSLSASAPDAQTAFGIQFQRGLIANAINPKVALFFLALLPQFVHRQSWPGWMQILVFGLLFALCSAIVFCLIAVCAGSIGRWLTSHSRAAVWADRATALVFVGIGVRLAMGDLPHATR